MRHLCSASSSHRANRRRLPPPGGDRAAILHGWLTTPTWDDTLAYLMRHAALLCAPETQALLEQWIAGAEAAGTPIAAEAGAYLRRHLVALRRAQQYGPAVAWDA
jgi:hypothetical protein